ncbi:hypothetical protein QVD17_28762 [Tagetes erecta]|uniref:MULE transposase domain-containing protein n=1 Tax=Tagetes erecta TaxID=13708 RepID=A0AAD8NSH1_TARER|nr:hypothetical protein QVD17_28762 [Tagetes erecta]
MFLNTIIGCESGDNCKIDILQRIDENMDIKSIDWCGCIFDYLKTLHSKLEKNMFKAILQDELPFYTFTYVETYKGVGVRLVSPTSRKVSYIPSANSSIKPAVGMKFNSIEHAFKRAFDSLNAENNKGKQKRRKPSSRVGCDAHVKLRLVNGKCDIYYFKEEHNNFFVHKDVMFLPAARRVDHVKESAIQALAGINLGPVRAFHILKSLMGGYAEVGATKADFKNYKRDLNKNIRESETADAYRWLLRTYINAFGNLPQVIVTDQDAAMKRAILDVLPNSRHRLCMWHIWDKVTVKVGSVLYSITPDEFEKQWDIILSDFGLSNHSWLHDIYDLRKDWILAYYQDEKLSGLMRTTSRCESENHFLNQFCNPTSTLVEFYGHFESPMEAQRYEHRKNDHDTRYTEPELWSAFVLEKQAAQIFTKTIFLDQQLKIDDALNNCLSVSVVHLNGVSNYEIKDFLQPCSEYFKVMI